MGIDFDEVVAGRFISCSFNGTSSISCVLLPFQQAVTIWDTGTCLEAGRS